MLKTKLTRPLIIYLYGLPGSGKTHIARQLATELGMAHISAERIRHELFDAVGEAKKEHAILFNLCLVLAEELLTISVPVVLDMSASRSQDRKMIREMAKRHNAESILVWPQIDESTARARSSRRDKRKGDDKYAAELSDAQFTERASLLQPLDQEAHIVLSGKLPFMAQNKAIIRRLSDAGLLSPDVTPPMAKPEMINLVSRAHEQALRHDTSARHISIQ